MRRSWLAVLLSLAVLVPASAQPSYAASGGRAAVPGDARFVVLATTRQVIVVSAPRWGSTTATLSAYAMGAAGRWARQWGPFPVTIGRNGMHVASTRREGDGTTPAGSFALTTTFGRLADPGTAMPYVRVSSSDYWVGDSNSAYYNEMRSSTRGGFDRAKSEHLSAISVYDFAIVVDFNRPRAVPGRGSAIFLHISDGRATAGCLSMSRQRLVALLRWLNPASHPRIVIGPATWLASTT